MFDRLKKKEDRGRRWGKPSVEESLEGGG